MRELIWTILFAALCFAAWVVTGKYSCYDDKLVDKTTIEVLEDYNKRLQEDNQRFMQYVPIPERKKEYIILLNEKGLTSKEIGKLVWVDGSYIIKCLKKWWVKPYYSVWGRKKSV